MASCLVVVDTQDVFIEPYHTNILSGIRRAVQNECFDYKVATKFINKVGSMYERYLGWTKAQSSEECMIDMETLSKCNQVFVKYGYSCFTKEFKQFIQENGIDRLYFVGFDIDGCILHSAITAFDLGIDFKIILDCCGTSGGSEIEFFALQILRRLIGGGQLVDLEEVLAEESNGTDGSC